MNPHKDGGPAFPGVEGSPGYGNSIPQFAPSGEVAWINQNQGMTLRDYFAGKALEGICSIEDERTCPQEMQHNVEAWRRSLYRHDARVAYMYADAMLAAREES